MYSQNNSKLIILTNCSPISIPNNDTFEYSFRIHYVLFVSYIVIVIVIFVYKILYRVDSIYI